MRAREQFARFLHPVRRRLPAGGGRRCCPAAPGASAPGAPAPAPGESGSTPRTDRGRRERGDLRLDVGELAPSKRRPTRPPTQKEGRAARRPRDEVELASEAPPAPAPAPGGGSSGSSAAGLAAAARGTGGTRAAAAPSAWRAAASAKESADDAADASSDAAAVSAVASSSLVVRGRGLGDALSRASPARGDLRRARARARGRC